jgi:hypothetical protein
MSEPTSAGGSGPAEQRSRAEVLASLARYLEADGWSPRRLPGRDAFIVSRAGAAYSCYAVLRADAEQLICYAIAPLRVPAERRPAAAEFVTRANYGLYHGNFELDYADGEVRAKCSLDFAGDRLTPALVRNTLLPAAHLLDAYLPGLRRVVFDGAEPRAAVEQIEAQP